MDELTKCMLITPYCLGDGTDETVSPTAFIWQMVLCTHTSTVTNTSASSDLFVWARLTRAFSPGTSQPRGTGISKSWSMHMCAPMTLVLTLSFLRIPGITTDYNATVLEGDSARQDGVESFVGGASTGSVGVAAMRYTNPSTKNFEFQKAWFFLDDNVQHILISSVSSKNSAPVLSILDQKRRSGPVMLSTSPTGALSEATSNSTKPVHALWNANVGYVFDRTFNSTEPSVFFQTGNRTGSWQSIGTSTQPPSTVDIFSAWIQHKQIIDKVTRSTAGYTVFPGVDAAGFESKRASTKLRTLRNEGHVSAVADDVHKTFMAVFWDAAGGSVQLSNETSIVASAASVLIYREVEGTITVADPSQSITTMTVKIIRSGAEKTITFTLPSGPGGTAGSSVTKSV
jgi:hypothetical protein